jgi:uracil phosphoribosyltransferase
MALRIVDHPLARVLVTGLRDAGTGPAEFRARADLLSELVLVEATRGLGLRPVTVQTPLAHAEGHEFAQGLAVVPVLRAGLSMLQAALRLFPNVAVGYIGLERSHETAVAASSYCKLPRLEGRHTLLVDPMLATGGSASQAVSFLKGAGASSVGLACVVAAQAGVERMASDHPDVDVVTAALDPELDANKYIVPGLGDFGDRLYGTL